MNAKTPTTLIQAVEFFANPDVAHDYLVSMRWPDGVNCPHCIKTTGEIHNRVSFISTRKVWKCKVCKKQFSVRVGTILEDSALPLNKWLVAIWLVVNAKNGISSYEIARSIGVKQESAWHMAHRIRVMLETGSIEKLDGVLEVDETVLGGKAKGMHADRRREERAKGFPKTTVFGVRQRKGEVRTMVVPDTQKVTLQTCIHEHIEENATVYTDSWKGYVGLSETYTHGVVDHKAGQYVDGDISTNGMENYWSILKRCYHGTYIHISKQHTHLYLKEEDFRFNNRKGKDGERFAKALTKISGKRLTYRELTESHLVHLDRS